jgi:hypothetical protein
MLARIAFYPCCAGDIDEPRRFLAPYVDDVLFCDLSRSKVWDDIVDEPGLPNAKFLHGDVRELIPTLPPLTTLFYRNDSNSEGGSGVKILGKELLKGILSRFGSDGGWIFSDGSNGGSEFRTMLTDDWHPKPRYGFEFRRGEVPEIRNRHGIILGAAQLRPLSTKVGGRRGWVPPGEA